MLDWSIYEIKLCVLIRRILRGLYNFRLHTKKVFAITNYRIGLMYVFSAIISNRKCNILMSSCTAGIPYISNQHHCAREKDSIFIVILQWILSLYFLKIPVEIARKSVVWEWCVASGHVGLISTRKFPPHSKVLFLASAHAHCTSLIYTRNSDCDRNVYDIWYVFVGF